MNFTTLRNLIGLAWTLFALLAALYNFAPRAYAVVAQYSDALPITGHIKRAAPDLWFNHQQNLLQSAAAELESYRQRMSTNRGRIDQEEKVYREKHHQASRLLEQARTLYQANPTAAGYNFIDKEYNAGSFSAQIVVLQGQISAARESLDALNKARSLQDQTWVKVAKKQAQISADQTRLATARLLWDTQHLLGDLDIDLELDGIGKISTHELRTVDELLQDAKRMSFRATPAMPMPPQSGLTDEALSILNGD